MTVEYFLGMSLGTISGKIKYDPLTWVAAAVLFTMGANYVRWWIAAAFALACMTLEYNEVRTQDFRAGMPFKPTLWLIALYLIAWPTIALAAYWLGRVMTQIMKRLGRA